MHVIEKRCGNEPPKRNIIKVLNFKMKRNRSRLFFLLITLCYLDNDEMRKNGDEENVHRSMGDNKVEHWAMGDKKI